MHNREIQIFHCFYIVDTLNAEIGCREVFPIKIYCIGRYVAVSGLTNSNIQTLREIYYAAEKDHITASYCTDAELISLNTVSST